MRVSEGQPKIAEDEEEGQLDGVTGWEPKRSKGKMIPYCHIPTGNFGTLQRAQGGDTPCLLRLLPSEI